MHIAPLSVAVGCPCAGGRGRRANIRLCISVAELGVTSTSGSLGGWRASCHFWVSGSTRTYTHLHAYSPLVAVQQESVFAKQQPTHWRTPTQTNKHTCCSWQSAGVGKASKTNSFIYMTVACFTLARCGNDGAKRYWKQQVMKSDRPVCRLESVQEGEACTLGTHPMQCVTRLAGRASVCVLSLSDCYCRADNKCIFQHFLVSCFPKITKEQTIYLLFLCKREQVDLNQCVKCPE